MDQQAVDDMIESLRPECAADVHLSAGQCHWDEIAEWKDAKPLATTVRVEVGPTTGIAEPSPDAVRREIARQREGHAGLLPDPIDPWYLTREERRP